MLLIALKPIRMGRITNVSSWLRTVHIWRYCHVHTLESHLLGADWHDLFRPGPNPVICFDLAEDERQTFRF